MPEKARTTTSQDCHPKTVITRLVRNCALERVIQYFRLAVLEMEKARRTG
jgi:hypothetical protein